MNQKVPLFDIDAFRRAAGEEVWQAGEQFFHDGGLEKIYKIGDVYEARSKEELPGLLRIDAGGDSLDIQCACNREQAICKHLAAVAVGIEAGKVTKRSPKVALRKELEQVREMVSNKDKVLFFEELLLQDEALAKAFVARFGTAPPEAISLISRNQMAKSIIDRLQQLKVSKLVTKRRTYDQFGRLYNFEKLEDAISEIINPIGDRGVEAVERGDWHMAVQCLNALIFSRQEMDLATRKFTNASFSYGNPVLEELEFLQREIATTFFAQDLGEEGQCAVIKAFKECSKGFRPQWLTLWPSFLRNEKAARLIFDLWKEFKADFKQLPEEHLIMALFTNDDELIEEVVYDSCFHSAYTFYQMLKFLRRKGREVELQELVKKAVKHNLSILSPHTLLFVDKEDANLFRTVFRRVNTARLAMEEIDVLKEATKGTSLQVFVGRPALMKPNLRAIEALEREHDFESMLVLAQLNPNHVNLAQMLKPNISSSPEQCFELIKQRVRKLCSKSASKYEFQLVLPLLRLLISVPAHVEQGKAVIRQLYRLKHRELRLVIDAYNFLD